MLSLCPENIAVSNIWSLSVESLSSSVDRQTGGTVVLKIWSVDTGCPRDPSRGFRKSVLFKKKKMLILCLFHCVDICTEGKTAGALP